MGSDKIRTFKDLDAWKEGHVLVLLIYKLTKQFPKDEVFGLVSQMRRAAVSITSNIAEGFARSSFKEKAQFYSIAKGSVTELENQLLISKDIGYITANEFISTEEKALRVNRIVHGLIQGSKKFLLLALFLIPYSIFFLSAPSVHAAARLQMPPNYLRTNSGLVGYWTMDGKNTNWGSNTTNDLSGNSNTGTMTNMSTTSSPAAGKIGQALNFDGVDDYVNVNDSSSLDVTGALTASVWFKMNNNPVTQSEGLVAKFRSQTGFTNQRAYMIVVETTGFIGATISSDGTNVPDSTSASATGAIDRADGKWHLATIVFIPSTSLTLYVDGVQEAQDTVSVPASIFNSPAPLWIGLTFNSTDAERYATALIDETRIYNRALTPSEVEGLFNSGAAKFNVSPTKYLTSGLVGYWTMDGKNTNWGSNTTNDLSGNNNTGTMTNMSTTSSPTAGKIGRALNFDGVDDYVQTPITDLNFSGGTVSWWQKSNRAFNDNAAIQAPWGQMTNGNIIPEFTAQKFTDGNWYVGWNRSGDNDRVSIAATAANWPQNTWSYYTFTWVSGGDSVLYQNGVQIGSKIGGTTVSTIVDNFVIGRQGRTHSAFFDGLIDEVRVYNRALSVDEIQSLYNSGR